MKNTSQTIAVIEKIYSFYESWALKLKLACDQGCATCCTQNVTLTRAEGELILTALRQDEARLQWLTEKLPIKTEIGRPLMSTNEWARRCIEDGEMSEGLATQVLKPCPFLDEKKSCSIYHLRPFSCRCFGSTVDCSLAGKAEQPDILIEVNTVTMQIIEHLDRGRWWGNMLDMLYALILLPDVDQKKTKQQLQETTQHLHPGKPLPGFLVMPEQQPTVQTYLDNLFALQFKQTTLGEILQIPL
jgi:Fe-S-cluster containining protein